MANGFVHLDVRKKTKENVMVKCKELYLQYHPEMKAYNITQDFMVSQIESFYRDPRGENK